MLTILLNILSSARLALVLVALVIILALFGVLLPQENSTPRTDMNQWQQTHPAISAVAGPLGLFRVFTSWPFLAIICALAVNTLTCTILFFFREGGFAAFKRPGALERAGFLFLHLGILGLMAGGAASAAFRSDGYIMLTEGQEFVDEQSNYLKLQKSLLGQDRRWNYTFKLKQSHIEYDRGFYPIDVYSDVEVYSGKQKVRDAVVRINHPHNARGLTFTQDQTGFSPRLVLKDKRTGRVMVNSFMALHTGATAQGREYKDYLPLPFLPHKVNLTLYPDHRRENSQIIKTGEEPVNPLLLVEISDRQGNNIQKDYLPLNRQVDLGNFTLEFADLRRWSSFRVSRDPGYPVVCVALWLALVALLARYIPELRHWFTERPDISIINDPKTDNNHSVTEAADNCQRHDPAYLYCSSNRSG